MTIKYLIISWPQNDIVINYISMVGTEEFFFISHYSFLAAESNLDSTVSHIMPRDITNRISFCICYRVQFTIIKLQLSVSYTSRGSSFT